MITFHILDTFAQDEEVREQTEEAKVVTYESEGECVSDDEFEWQKKKAANYGNIEKKSLVIHLFGVTDAGISVRANVYGFEPFFYLRLPDAAAKTKTAFKLKFADAIKAKGVPASSVTVSFCEKKLLYGYTGGKRFPFAKIQVKSIAAWQKVK